MNGGEATRRRLWWSSLPTWQREDSPSGLAPAYLVSETASSLSFNRHQHHQFSQPCPDSSFSPATASLSGTSSTSSLVRASNASRLKDHKLILVSVPAARLEGPRSHRARPRRGPQGRKGAQEVRLHQLRPRLHLCPPACSEHPRYPAQGDRPGGHPHEEGPGS